MIWEGNVFGAGGYESASRFLLQGLFDAAVDVEVRPLWGDEVLVKVEHD